MRSQATRTLTGLVNSDGTIARIGTGGWTSRRIATGNYVVQPAPGLRFLGASVVTSAASNPSGQVSLGNENFGVLVYSSGTSPVAVDSAFAFTATVAA